MCELSIGEKNFINSGGLLWCMTQLTDDRWQLSVLFAEDVRIFRVRPESLKRAEDWIFALANLSSLANNVNIHHSVMRRNTTEKENFPVIFE